MFLLPPFLPVSAQSNLAPGEKLELSKRLAEEQKWDELIRSVPDSPDDSSDIDFYRGIALAQLGRYAEAEQVLRRGAAKSPRETRFSLELAGVAYRQKRFADAKSALRNALKSNPEDSYANNFLASIFFLEGNLEAALKYWNRVGRPVLADLSFDPEPRVKPVLLDRAFPFSLLQRWTVADYLESSARIQQLGIFARERYVLGARPDGNFDLVLHAWERNGWGANPLEGALLLLRDLPHQGVRLELYNLGRKAVNWRSQYRWDAQKRRLATEVTAPLGLNPAWSFRIYFDGRNENWNISRTLFPLSAPAAGVNMRRIEAGAEIRSIVNERTSWMNGVILSSRRYRNHTGIPSEALTFFEDGSSLLYQTGIEHSLYRLPERRFTLDAGIHGQFGKHFSRSLGAFARLNSSLRLDWFPRAKGDNDEIESTLRSGYTFGRVAFDELSVLGVERDNDLWLRGHKGTRDRKKGNAPLGTNYLLWSLDYRRKIFRGNFLGLRAGPFLDAGRITEPSGTFGSRQWLWDAGIETRVRVLGAFEIVLGYGRDLRGGGNAFFATVGR